ncbi:hypothetical protein FRC09_016138, partial [Ceratobasidium sp. 395]
MGIPRVNQKTKAKNEDRRRRRKRSRSPSPITPLRRPEDELVRIEQLALEQSESATISEHLLCSKRRKVTVEEVEDIDMPNPPRWGPHPHAQPTRRSLYPEPHSDRTAGVASHFIPVDLQPPPLYDTKLAEPDVYKEAYWLSNLPISEEEKEEYLHLPRTKGWHWDNFEKLKKEIDSLPHGPDWHRETIRVKGDEDTYMVLDLWKRDIVELVRWLIRNRRFIKHMRFAPERNWTSDCETTRKRVHGEMWSSDWWEQIQNLLPEGATVAPIILSSDKTKLTTFSGNKKAWPVYLSIGNISKEFRRRPSERAMVLVGYIPVSDLEHISNAECRKEAKWQLFHTCMESILEPLKSVSLTGVDMLCADGGIRRVHPVLAAYIADFEEQSLVTCVERDRCPVCWVPADEKADYSQEYELRTRRATLDALEDHRAGWSATIDVLGIRPTGKPFWAGLPFVEISNCITPDLLHQIHKGVFKDHLVKWCTAILGAGEVDRRIKGMPRFQYLRHFKHGTSRLSQWTGTESKALASIFLPTVAGCKEAEVVTAARSLLDFMYRAHMPELSEDDLELMDHDLATFHSVRHIFIDAKKKNLLNAEHRFDGIPKLHMLSHYTSAIRLLGTPDGYNSELTERLHIDYVKIAWRASNHVNETPQMATYLQRQEAWVLLRAYLHDTGLLLDPRCDPIESDEPDDSTLEDETTEDNITGVENKEQDAGDDLWYPNPAIAIAKRPAFARRSGHQLIHQHHATDLIPATLRFLADKPVPGLFLSEHAQFKVWTRCKLHHRRLPFLPSLDPQTDQVRARPGSVDDEGRDIRIGNFDVVLYSPHGEDVSDLHGIHRLRAGRVRAIFELPPHLSRYYSEKLVYIEHFRPLSKGAPTPLSLHSTSHMTSNGRRCASVIPLSQLRMACHLVPKFCSLDPKLSISSSTDLLAIQNKFYLN